MWCCFQSARRSSSGIREGRSALVDSALYTERALLRSRRRRSSHCGFSEVEEAEAEAGMPFSPVFSRRNGLWHDIGHSRRASCAPRTRLRVLYVVIATLLAALLLLSQRQFAIYQVPGTSVGCGAAQDTLRSVVVLPAKTVIQVGAADGDARRRSKVLAFVGIQTGYGSAERRRALRQTWLPSTQEGLLKMEEELGLVFRFVIGHTRDARSAAELEKEIEEHRDFLRIDNEEEYARLPFKTLAYFKAAYMLFDADFYVKADDDIYLRPDRLALLLRKQRHSSRTYLGCMKKGNVIANNAFKWYEPLGYLLGSEYFYHAYGPIYALSRDVVNDLSNFRNDSMRMFSNEDVTIGSWMLAFNVHHEDDRSLCQASCQDNFVAVWDIPRCSGLCNPEQKLLELHQQEICFKSPTLPNS